jgi:hypothetical protein
MAGIGRAPRQTCRTTREMSHLIRTKPATQSAAQGSTGVYSANIGTESSSAFSSVPPTYFESEVMSVVVLQIFQAAAMF